MIHRTQQGAPDREGWFYGRSKWSGSHIIPQNVTDRFAAALSVWTDEQNHPLNDFDWFGPVPECREG